MHPRPAGDENGPKTRKLWVSILGRSSALTFRGIPGRGMDTFFATPSSLPHSKGEDQLESSIFIGWGGKGTYAE
jgi:hypothetical protein